MERKFFECLKTTGVTIFHPSRGPARVKQCPGCLNIMINICSGADSSGIGTVAPVPTEKITMQQPLRSRLTLFIVIRMLIRSAHGCNTSRNTAASLKEVNYKNDAQNYGRSDYSALSRSWFDLREKLA